MSQSIVSSTAVTLLWLSAALSPPMLQAAESGGIFDSLYLQNCSVCHGPQLEGTHSGAPLKNVALRHGDSIDAIASNITHGFPQNGMPAMGDTFDAAQILQLAIYIAEQRAHLSYLDFKVKAPITLPTGVQKSEAHNFRVETVATGLDPFPYSLAALPDGNLLVTEKTRGLKLIGTDGNVTMIEGTPMAYDDSFKMPGLAFIIGTGWLMDVAVDPDYASNGWIWLQYGDRCQDCNEVSRTTKQPVTMNKLVRGHISDGKWMDQKTIWQAPIEQYTPMTDQGAGGRIAFDHTGHVFISIGMKGAGIWQGIQDLALPYGKILRLNRDGSIPADNPYAKTPGALAAIWSYGHRSPQGLEFDTRTSKLWETEMGPRGGDEVNLIQPGKNYGWPLTSKGMNYDGTVVDFGKELGISVDLKTIEQPVVDLTPAPAVSSFIIYEGSRFLRWQHNLLVGTLKATELYRMVVDGNNVVHRETVLKDVGRIRDITTAPDGSILLLIEHIDGGRILKLVNAD